MIDFNVTVKRPTLKFEGADSKRLWSAVAIEAQKEIRQRTESKGVDAESKSFKPYDQAYREYRQKKGRSSKPNLSFTGRMLGSMQAIGRKTYGLVRLTGEQGFKALMNEQNGRVFFALSDSQKEKIFKQVVAWVTKENKLR